MHMEMSLPQRSTQIMKDGLEPFHLVGTARCASRGQSQFICQTTAAVGAPASPYTHRPSELCGLLAQPAPRG